MPFCRWTVNNDDDDDLNVSIFNADAVVLLVLWNDERWTASQFDLDCLEMLLRPYRMYTDNQQTAVIQFNPIQIPAGEYINK